MCHFHHTTDAYSSIAELSSCYRFWRDMRVCFTSWVHRYYKSSIRIMLVMTLLLQAGWYKGVMPEFKAQNTLAYWGSGEAMYRCSKLRCKDEASPSKSRSHSHMNRPCTKCIDSKLQASLQVKLRAQLQCRGATHTCADGPQVFNDENAVLLKGRSSGVSSF